MLTYRKVNIIAAVAFSTLIAYDLYEFVAWYTYLIFGIVWFLITGLGSWFIRWNYHMDSLHSNPSISNNKVAITFDDGPHPDYTPKVLDLLAHYRMKATFFLIGKHAEHYPKIVERILEEGHTIGNHTYSHAKNFGFLSTSKVKQDLERTNTIINKLTGLKLLLFRPAFGVTNPKIARAVNELKMSSIAWTKRSYDTTQLSEERIFHRVSHQTSKGDIILLHDTSQKSIAVLERLLLFLQSNGMRSVTVDQLLHIKAYA